MVKHALTQALLGGWRLVQCCTMPDARIDGLHVLLRLCQHLPAHVAGTLSCLLHLATLLNLS